MKHIAELYVPDMKGCSDGNCIFKKNTGMVTNGGCSCERELNRTELGRNAVRTIRYLRIQALVAYDAGYSTGWDDAS